MHDEQTLTSNMELILVGPDGVVKKTVRCHNTVKTAGKDGAADQILASPSLNKPTHMGIGSGTPGATALGTELDRNAFTTKTRTGAVVTMIGNWAAADGTGTITEAGLFDAASTGNMWCCANFTGIVKEAGDTLQITWTLTVA